MISAPGIATGFRGFLASRRGAIALLFVAPAIPELLTGSTPITRLVVDPLGFAVSFGLDIGLYGTGALLIREFVVVYRKGWASVLLLGAAYGIGEEGFAVHTFFQPSGAPVGALAAYGAAGGVNWLWALGLTVFHATYSIALPILWVHLWFPTESQARWLRPRTVVVAAIVYVGEVGVFGAIVPHGPRPPEFALFGVLATTLIVIAAWAPANLLRVRPGPSRRSPLGLALAGTLGFDAWFLVIVLSGSGRVPAVLAAVSLVAIDAAALTLVVRSVGRDDLRPSEFWFSTGMLGILFVFDGVVEASVPGILGVAALFGWLQYRLGQRVLGSVLETAVPPGVTGQSGS